MISIQVGYLFKWYPLSEVSLYYTPAATCSQYVHFPVIYYQLLNRHITSLENQLQTTQSIICGQLLTMRSIACLFAIQHTDTFFQSLQDSTYIGIIARVPWLDHERFTTDY